jgi:hypothetical protein
MKTVMKDDKTDHSSYQGISVLSTTYKILSSILLSRFTPHVEEIMGNISVDFDIQNQLLIRYSPFDRYWRKNGVQWHITIYTF